MAIVIYSWWLPLAGHRAWPLVNTKHKYFTTSFQHHLTALLDCMTPLSITSHVLVSLFLAWYLSPYVVEPKYTVCNQQIPAACPHVSQPRRGYRLLFSSPHYSNQIWPLETSSPNYPVHGSQTVVNILASFHLSALSVHWPGNEKQMATYILFLNRCVTEHKAETRSWVPYPTE